MKAGRTLPRCIVVGAMLAAIAVPALAGFGAVSSWAVYGFFAFVAMVVIVLLLHEVLDDSESESTMQTVEDKRAEPDRPRYAAKHVPDNASSFRRIV